MDRMEETACYKAVMKITCIFSILSILKSCYFSLFLILRPVNDLSNLSNEKAMISA
jgi:hypothetical protein